MAPSMRKNESEPNRASMSVWRVVAAAVALATTLPSAAAWRMASECCSTCIGKQADSVYDYDPTVYEQCKLSPNGARVCCFDCAVGGQPSYGDTVSYASDGTTPTVKAGTWVSFQWSAATKVTYVSLKDGQKKVSTPTLNDTAATVESGFYMICAKAKGSIIFRAWGSDTCRQASGEQTVQVLDGDAGATCEAKAPTAPTTTKAPSASSGSSSGSSEDPDIKNCNMNRATIKDMGNGKKECVCVSDWTGAPACDQMPTWKWIITIGGGIAALFSILISIHAFMKSRQKKKQEEESADDVVTPAGAKDDVEILRIGADRPSANAPKQGAYRRGNDENNGVYKMNDREFSL